MRNILLKLALLLFFMQTEGGIKVSMIPCSEDNSTFWWSKLIIPANHLEAGKFYMVNLVVHMADRMPGNAKQMVSTQSICPEM